MGKFKKELEQLINKHSKEYDSDTPDFILAEYLKDCLAAFNRAVNDRSAWYHGKPRTFRGLFDTTM
jgi:hypothetical protein